MKSTSIKALSIQISLSGLSFCILNRSNHSIELLEVMSLEKKATPYELLNTLSAYVESNPVFDQAFDSVLCIHQNELACLVPEEVFDETNLADYLKFNAKILKTDFISYDTMAANQSMNVFVPLVNINNYIFDTFGSFEYKHASTIFIETLMQSASNYESPSLFINVNEGSFEMVCIQNQQLKFYNRFEFQTKEDFIYYVLFTVEQLHLNPESIKVNLSGTIAEGDDNYAILYKYIRYISFIEPLTNFSMDSTNDYHGAKHENFILLNSFN